MNRYVKGILILLGIVALNLGVQQVVVRWDLTSDHRYTVSSHSRTELQELSQPLTITLYLEGDMNPGFRKLQQATQDLLAEFRALAKDVQYRTITDEERQAAYRHLEQEGFAPIVVHERATDGRTVQTKIYPYAELQYGTHTRIVNLLQQDRSKSGEENLNHSTETLEYTFMEAIHNLKKGKVERIAFLEGHGELPEENVYDWSWALSRYFQVDRGMLGTDAGVLDDYKAVIIADPQVPFSDTDKYILDQYLMQGGCLMWLVNGVKFSQNMMSESGVTPIVAQDLNLTDMFFHYGVRINPALVQDLQCLNVPVDVSRDPENPQYQPLPWTYAPLLLTSDESPITCGVMQVSSAFVSCIDIVGGEDGIQKNVLLATSSASRFTGSPAEVDLSDLSVMPEQFNYQYLPVAASLEGIFPSVFAHRMTPEGIQTTTATRKQSVHTKQVVVASGNIARNETEQGRPLPVGYDRYSKMQFGNRDFLVNAILWLTDDSGLISLRQKVFTLRLLNDHKSHQALAKIRIISILTPVLLLLLIGCTVWGIRKHLYTL